MLSRFQHFFRKHRFTYLVLMTYLMSSLIYTPVAQASTLTDNSSGTFNIDTGDDDVAVQWDAANSWVEQSTNGTDGTYISDIKDAKADVLWSTLAWVPNRPAGKELPSSQSTPIIEDDSFDTTGLAIRALMNESSGVIGDTSGNGYDGTATGVTYSSLGVYNTALSFDGVDDEVDFGNITESQGTALTLSLWMKQTSLAIDKNIVTKWNPTNSTNNSILFRTDLSASDELVFFASSSSSDAGANYCSTTDANLTVGRWYHLAVVYDGSGVNNTDKVKIYRDGTALTLSCGGTIPADIYDTTQPLMLGSTDSGKTPITGSMDDVAIFSRALSSNEVASIAAGTADNNTESAYTTGNFDPTNLLALYHMNEASGDLRDDSGNHFNCTANALSYAHSESKVSDAIDFDGSTSYADCGDKAELSFTDGTTDTAFSVCTWLNSDVDQTAMMASKMKTVSSTKYYEWQFGTLTNKKFQFYLYSNGGGTAYLGLQTDTNSVVTGTWQHVCATYDGSKTTGGLTFYINGASANITPTNNSYSKMIDTIAPLRIGDQDISTSRAYFNGTLDEMSIWDEELTSTEVLDMYKRGALRQKFQARCCNDSACLGESFMGPDSSTSAYFTESTTNTIALPSVDISGLTACAASQYFQYKTLLESDSTSYTPELKSVAIVNGATDAVAGVTITQSVASTDVTEGGSTDTYTMVLDALPTADVVITPACEDTDSGCTTSPATLTFTTGNWDTPQTVTVTATNDTLYEGDHSSAVGHTASSADGNYNAIVIADVTVNITDNDTAPTVSIAVDNASISETGGVSTVTATLSAASGLATTVTISASGTATGSGADYTLSTTSISITAGNTTGTATITAATDTTDEANETVIVDVDSVTNGTEDGTQQVTVTITDDDAAPTVSIAVNNASISETSGSSTVTATLSAASGQDVTVNLSASGTATGSGTDYTLSTISISISAGNTTGTASISSALDTIDEADETVIIDISSVTNGTESGTQQVTVTITDDDDAPTVSIAVDSATIGEGAVTSTITATLSAASGRDVTVNLSASGTATGSGTDYTLSSSSITISSGETTGTATIFSEQDLLDETDETVIIDISSVTNGTESGTQQVTVTITDDDDAPSVTLSVDNISISETSGSATVTATLSDASGQDVTINLSASGTATGSGTDYTLSGSSISISAGNTTGTVTISSALDTLDEDDETAIVDISSVTNGTEVGTQQITVTITDDDDAPTVSIAVNNESISETSGSSTLTATLSAASGRDVTVTLSASGTATGSGTDYTLSTTSISISAGSTTGTASISSALDTLDENNETVIVDVSDVTNATESGAQQVTVTITDDDDPPTVSLSVSSATISEGAGFATVTATLSTASGKDVTVDLAASGTATGSGTDYTLFSNSISISAGSTTGTTTVFSSTDSIDESDETIILDISGVTNGSESGTQQQTITITDDDTAGITVAESGGVTNVTEGSTTDTFTVVLNSQPTANVSISLTDDADSDVDVLTLTFTNLNWDTAQTVTVTPVDDDIAEGAHTSAISFGVLSADSGYNATSITDITVNITDDDSAGVSVTESGGATSVTEGSETADTYTIVLTSEPTANVVVTPNPASSCDVSPSSVTFTSANWNTAQTISVTSSDNDLDDGNHTCTISHGASSVDADYDGVAVNSVSATVVDNDAAGVTIAESSGSTSVDVDGTSDTYTVVLTAEPTASVTVTPSGGTDVNVSPTTLTFSTANWDTPQTVTVTWDEASGSSATVTNTATSSDSGYNGISISSVTVTITDAASAEEEEACSTTLVASAGSDVVINTSDTVTLSGASSTGCSVTYSWAITSGDGSLSSATNATPVFTSAGAGTSVVTLTVTDENNETASDTVSIVQVSQAVTSALPSEQIVLSGSNYSVSETARGSGSITLSYTYDGNAFTIIVPNRSASTLDYNIAITNAGFVIVCFPEALTQQGICYVSRSTADTLLGSYELNERKSTPSDFSSVSGSVSGDRFGHAVGSNVAGDYVYISAPEASSNGVINIYELVDGSSPNLSGSVFGSLDYPACSAFQNGFVLEDADSIYFGDCNASSNAQLNLTSTATGDAGTDSDSRGLSAGELPYIFTHSIVDSGSTINLSTSDPDLAVDCTNCELQSTAFGDVNNDGEEDMLLCTSETAYVVYGPHSLSVALSLDDADVTINNDVSDPLFCRSSAIGDITGDGVADIIIGGENALYIVYGSAGLSSSLVVADISEDISASVSVASSSSVSIVSGADIGSDILVKSGSIYSGDGLEYTVGGSSSVGGGSGGSSGGSDKYFGCQLGSGENADISPLALCGLLFASLIYFREKHVDAEEKNKDVA